MYQKLYCISRSNLNNNLLALESKFEIKFIFTKFKWDYGYIVGIIYYICMFFEIWDLVLHDLISALYFRALNRTESIHLNQEYSGLP